MLFKVFGIFFAWTWILWAFLFVFCLVAAISRAIQEAGDGQDHKSALYTFWAALFFAVILGGLSSLFALL